jgi:hypothetical protein
MKSVMLFVFLSVFLCVLVPAFAQDEAPSQSSGENLESADETSDGARILEKILERRREMNIPRMDLNNDGRIDDLERINYRAKMKARERKAIESDPELNAQDLLEKERERADKMMREMRDGHIARVAELDRKAKMSPEERAALDAQRDEEREKEEPRDSSLAK